MDDVVTINLGLSPYGRAFRKMLKIAEASYDCNFDRCHALLGAIRSGEIPHVTFCEPDEKTCAINKRSPASNYDFAFSQPPKDRQTALAYAFAEKIHPKIFEDWWENVAKGEWTCVAPWQQVLSSYAKWREES
jgi:hypothetical protein